MSLSRECAFVEYKPNEWYLLLARDEHGELYPGDADAYGAFDSFENAHGYLGNFSNPGGFWVHKYDGKFSVYEEQLIARAEKPTFHDPFAYYKSRF